MGERPLPGDRTVSITGAAGSVRLGHLPPGQYLFSAAGERASRKMIITVPGPELVRFAPQRMNALRVTAHDPEGYLGSAGFETGDLIVGAGGEDFEDEVDMEARLLRARRDRSVPLDVVRGARHLTILTDVATARDLVRAGGVLDPVTR
jgi:hypothetical protein